MNPTRIAIAGCTGRMGRVIARLAAADPAFEIVGAITIPGDPLVNGDLGTVAGFAACNVSISATPPERCDVLIDFTSPEGTGHWARWCAEQRIALVSGTTGLTAEQHEALRKASASAAVLWASNMSVGVNLLIALAEQVSARLGDEWDIEIVEGHHNKKADAPSGTAKSLLQAICAARGVKDDEVASHGRSGVVGARPRGQIGVHAVRMGGVVGDHDVHFASPGEIVTLRHHAETRDIFAAGALRAARWIADRRAGMYSMRDVLGV